MRAPGVLLCIILSTVPALAAAGETAVQAALGEPLETVGIEPAAPAAAPTADDAYLSTESPWTVPQPVDVPVDGRLIEELESPAGSPQGRPMWTSPVEPGDPCDDYG